MNLFQEAARLSEENRPFAIATILDAKGSTPRSHGRMLITPDGTTLGTVGGGAMELFVVKEATDALALGQPRTVRRDLVQSGERAVGMDCGGTMEVHIDVVGKRPTLVLVGGGHVNLAIAQASAPLDYDVVIQQIGRAHV